MTPHCLFDRPRPNRPKSAHLPVTRFFETVYQITGRSNRFAHL